MFQAEQLQEGKIMQDLEIRLTRRGVDNTVERRVEEDLKTSFSTETWVGGGRSPHVT